MHIHYIIERLSTNIKNEPAHITEQWQRVINECQSRQFGELERARLAFTMVDYITSEDLPLRLLITRAPQAMALISEETRVHKENSPISGRKGGVIYSRQELVLPKTLEYNTRYEAKRIVDGTPTPLSGSNLLECLKAGDVLTPLDGILFLNCKRIAADIARLKKRDNSLAIEMKRIEVSDSFTGTTRRMASYIITNKG